MTHLNFTDFLVATLVLVAAAGDIRCRRIPNWLTLGGIVTGLLAGAATAGWRGLGQSTAGMLLGFTIYLGFYCLRAMGAGDVKLMAAVGAIVGPSAWLHVFIGSAIAGAAFAVVLSLRKGRLQETWRNTGCIVYELMHLRVPYRRRSDLDVRDPHGLKLPHAVAIAVGAAIWILRIQPL